MISFIDKIRLWWIEKNQYPKHTVISSGPHTRSAVDVLINPPKFHDRTLENDLDKTGIELWNAIKDLPSEKETRQKRDEFIRACGLSPAYEISFDYVPRKAADVLFDPPKFPNLVKKPLRLVLEGPDSAGKSNIATELSKKLDVPYFKNKAEWSSFKNNPEYFINAIRYGDPFLLSFLEQSGGSVIFDRSYPSEWVYSQALGRETDMNVLTQLDEWHSRLGTKIVVCHRSSYENINDDMFSELNSSMLQSIDALYHKFCDWTRCEIMKLNVDDEDLDREINDIMQFIKVRR